MAPLLVSPPPMDIHNSKKKSHSDIIVGGYCLTQARRSAIPACIMSMTTTRMGMYTSTSKSYRNKNKKLRRNVSWNIQPSKILHLSSESAIKKQKRDHNHNEKKDDDDDDDDNSSAKDGSMTNEIWYSVSIV
jgi:hypothetical protein